MDKNLNFTEHLAKTYKKASSRVTLLARIGHNICPEAAETVYKTMIFRAIRVINNNSNLVSLPTVNHVRNKRCASF